jgi:hypothetical protein
MEAARFKPGDMVLVLRASRYSPWIVLADDTNHTPVRDPEPAYRLRLLKGQRERYAYESELQRG